MKQLTVFLSELERGSKKILHTFKNEDFSEKLANNILASTPSSIRFEMNVEKIGGGVLLSGHYYGVLYLRCSRCADEFAFKLDSDFRQVFVHLDDVKLEEEMELTEEELETDYYTGQEINLEPYLKDLIALEVPMVPICSSSCKGMDYKQTVIESSSPWDVLKDFKPEHKKDF